MAKKPSNPSPAPVPTPEAEAAPATPRDPMHGPWQLGKCYLIRTVTMYQVGRLIGIYPLELELADASWIPDMGRFHDALKKGKDVFREVEPFVEPAIIGRGAISDATVWPFALPADQK